MPQERRCEYCDAILSEDNSAIHCNRNCTRESRQGSVPVRRKGEKPVCPQCNVSFLPTINKQIYCTSKCQEIASRRTRACALCGASYLSGRRESITRPRMCSKECSAKYREQVRAQMKIDRFGPPRTCRWCGVTFGYGGEAYKGWCSKSCRAEYTKDYERRLGHERRARLREVTIEVFSPAYILKRDKYICQACGKKTKPKEKPTHPLYPNVDHIVPLAAGGEHSKKNCRCVCASCNSQKREGTLNDQLLLFG